MGSILPLTESIRISRSHKHGYVRKVNPYGKCPKISNTKVSHKMPYANSADLDQTKRAVWSGSSLFAIPLSILTLAEHGMPCLSKQCRSRSVGFCAVCILYILNQKRNFRKVGLKLIRLNTTCRKMCICSSLH